MNDYGDPPSLRFGVAGDNGQRVPHTQSSVVVVAVVVNRESSGCANESRIPTCYYAPSNTLRTAPRSTRRPEFTRIASIGKKLLQDNVALRDKLQEDLMNRGSFVLLLALATVTGCRDICTCANRERANHAAALGQTTSEDGEDAMGILHERTADGTIDEVGARLEQAAQKHKFGVLNVIDLKAKMAGKGVEFGPECRIYEVCNPDRAKKVLESNMSISTALPCRIALYQESGQVKLSTLLPTKVLGLFGPPELNSVAKAVEDDIKAIIDEATAGKIEE